MASGPKGLPPVLPTHTPALFDAAVERAAALLRADEVVALPTETVYGLAANALSPRAVARLYEVKGRPAHNPIIVHVAGAGMARTCTTDWTPAAARLAAAFWPGPLTLVLRRPATIPPIVAAGGDTVGLRWPSHPFMQAVIRACEFPLAAPSANLSNQLSPTNADHVLQGLGGRVPLIVDGGQCQVGIESTVVDVTGPTPRLLRPGMIPFEAILAAAAEGGAPEIAPGSGPTPPRADSASETGASEAGPLQSPGLLARHYSPKARLLIRRWETEEDLRAQLRKEGLDPDRCHIVAYDRIPAGGAPGLVSVIPDDAEAYARALYGELHRCDQEGATVVVVEAVPDKPEWSGIADRLRRAAAPRDAGDR